jgi:maltooligosyltrehalose trehalohydrolase
VSVVIRVWSPGAQQVAVVWSVATTDPDVDAESSGDVTVSPMTVDADGWWSVTLAVPGDGVPIDYAFSVDGGDPRPDPRSPWQPRGVHAPSRTFDPTAYLWGDGDWRGTRGGRGVAGGVVYELHVGTFTPEGTFAAAVAHLDHLVALGVDLVEIMPVSAFDGPWGWGYDGVQPYAVHHAYGGPAAFQRFVDACHVRGLGVGLDVVYNHLGPSGNYLGEFGPYFTDAHVTPWGPAVNLDGPGSHEVRRWIIDNAVRWLRDFHVDALRLDAVHELRDDSERHLLAELSDEIGSLARELGRPLDLIAESDLNDPVMVTPTAEGGLGMTAQWDDDIHHALHVALTGETEGYYADFAGGTEAWPEGGSLSVLAKTLTDAFLHDGRVSTFRGRPWGRKVDPEARSGHQFLAYLQTHDQVGNRATGDRISDSVSPGQQAIGAALYLLSPFTPMIFMGEEWRASTPFAFFTSFSDEALADAVRHGRRAEFAAHGWAEDSVPDPQDRATRDASVLRWYETANPGHVEMMHFYVALLKVRRAEPDVASGDLRATSVQVDEDARWIVLSRGSVHVVANLAGGSQEVPFSGEVERVLASWGRAPIIRGEGVRLDGHDVVVVRTF